MMSHSASAATAQVFPEQVRASFLAVGAVPGDTIIFHSSLKSMGYVVGGPETVFAGILSAAHPGGTVAAPSLWYSGKVDEKPELFAVKTSPTYVGALPEALRVDPRSFRSNHWSHAIAARGSRARELTVRHRAGKPRPSPWCEFAFATGSPWWRLYQWNALYAFIGVSMRYCTMKHAIEGLLVQECLETIPAEHRGQARAELRLNREGKVWPFYSSEGMQQVLIKEGLVRQTKLGGATLMAIRTRPLVERTLARLKAEPKTWLAKEFQQWVDNLSQYRMSK